MSLEFILLLVSELEYSASDNILWFMEFLVVNIPDQEESLLLSVATNSYSNRIYIPGAIALSN